MAISAGIEPLPAALGALLLLLLLLLLLVKVVVLYQLLHFYRNCLLSLLRLAFKLYSYTVNHRAFQTRLGSVYGLLSRILPNSCYRNNCTAGQLQHWEELHNAYFYAAPKTKCFPSLGLPSGKWMFGNCNLLLN